jgi:hypothetical protein
VSLPSLDLTLPTDHLRVTPLSDPVIDLLGHDLRSAYVERFWLPILGPTTVLLLRRLGARLDEHPEGFDLPLLDTAAAMGLGNKGGRNAPFLRAIARSTKFKITQRAGTSGLAVHRRVAPLTRIQVERLPGPLRDEHARWQQEAVRAPDLEQQRRRARRLALSLAELGEDDEAIEQQLHRWKIHPALAHESLRWARTRQRGGPVAATRGAAFSPTDVAPTPGVPAGTAPQGAVPPPSVPPSSVPARAVPPRVLPSTGDAA